MTRAQTQEYLEDIRPTMLKLRQVEYLLALPIDYDNLKGVSYGEKVSTYSVGDTTANTVANSIDKLTDRQNLAEELSKKIALYHQWLSNLTEIQRQLAVGIYIDGHSTDWLAHTRGYEPTSIRVQKSRLIGKLSEIEIYTKTEKEKEMERL